MSTPKFEDLKGSALYSRLSRAEPQALVVDGKSVGFLSLVGQLPPARGVIAPEGGWKQQTYYVVEVAFSSGNPIHRAILYVGFIPETGNPLLGGYTCLLQATYDKGYDFLENVYYLKPVCEIKEMA